MNRYIGKTGLDALIELIHSTLQLKITGKQGQVAGFDENGNLIATTISTGGGGTSNNYAFEIGDDGNLYVVYEDGTSAPDFYINQEDGCLYLNIGGE